MKRFIAYKRTQLSEWAFAPYSQETSDAIDEIAPARGNFAKVILVPEEELIKAQETINKLKKKLEDA